jgi:hypothetical protein
MQEKRQSTEAARKKDLLDEKNMLRNVLMSFWLMGLFASKLFVVMSAVVYVVDRHVGKGDVMRRENRLCFLYRCCWVSNRDRWLEKFCVISFFPHCSTQKVEKKRRN